MSLDTIPSVSTFLGVANLKTGSLIIAALGIAHPLVYGCTLCQSISYLVVTMWILVVGYCAVSIVLLVGIFQSSSVMISVFIWYAMVFVVVMVILMGLLVYVAASNDRRCTKAFCAIVAIVWYLFTIYFIVVVNSYRKTLKK